MKIQDLCEGCFGVMGSGSVIIQKPELSGGYLKEKKGKWGAFEN